MPLCKCQWCGEEYIVHIAPEQLENKKFVHDKKVSNYCSGECIQKASGAQVTDKDLRDFGPWDMPNKRKR